MKRVIDKRIFLLIVLGIFLVSTAYAQEVSHCCERTNSGAWCQNSPESECDSDYLSAPTSCDATSYCRLGVCINSEEGNCMPNSPERVCIDSGGVWDLRSEDEIPQCQLGCCLIGDQAAFVTLTKCRSLSSACGLEIDYRTDITTEIACIASASPEEKGACVYEKEFEKSCEMITKAECQERQVSIESAEFHEGYLCSAEALGTVCAPRGGTTCVEGKDEVYFTDTCGNIANIYNYNKLNDEDYWTYLRPVECTVNVNNAASRRQCGNCDYVGGNTCKKPERGNSPSYGSYICEDLGCTYEGQRYEHGETWCANSEGTSEITSTEGAVSGSGEDLPGGSHTRLICYNGEVTVEPCAEFRQEVCIEGSIGGFSTADCRANKWQDCLAQTTEEDCENNVQRYCRWTDSGKCVPLFVPGFNFWEEGDAESICGLATTECRVGYEKSLYDLASGGLGEAFDLDCIEQCRQTCLWDDPALICKKGCVAKCKDQACVDSAGKIKQEWKDNANDFCNSLGDCGSKDNYRGLDGYYTSLDKLISRSNATK